MKKVFLLALGLVLGFSAVAQKANIDKKGKNIKLTAAVPSQERISDGTAVENTTFAMPENMMQAASYRSADDFEEFESMATYYDLQSNSALGNRIAVWPDGKAAFVATWDNSNTTSFPNRGTGYNFYDGSDMGDMPDARQEDVKSGWPSIAVCGNGELLASHASGVNVYYRPTRGTGAWTLLKNFGTEWDNPTWPRIICSGENDQYIHLVMCKQVGSASPYDNHIYYTRSNDLGQTWSDVIDLPLIDNDDVYMNNFSADDYVMAANGDNVAVLLGSYTTDVVYVISHDNGATWERQIVAPYPIEGAHAYAYDEHPEGWWSPLVTSDNSHSIAIDNNGVVHVVFGLFRWQPTDDSHYTYWPVYNYGVLYWNSEYTNEQGGHEIPLLGDWSGDTQFEEFGDTLGYSLDIDRIVALCDADGGEHLWISGYPVEIDEETGDTASYQSAHFLNAPYSYRTDGNVTMPAISVDEHGRIAIIYSIRSKTRINDFTSMYYRSAYVTCRDRDGRWFDDAINLSEDFDHSMDEVYPTTASPVAYNSEFWTYYSADMKLGLYLDISDSYPQSNEATLTNNVIYAVKITPHMEGWDGVDEPEMSNPLTTTRVFPNPATDMMTVEINASQDAEATISVYNITGQNVMDMNVNVNTGINHRSISTSELSSGVYFVTVNANGFSKTTKVVVK